MVYFGRFCPLSYLTVVTITTVGIEGEYMSVLKGKGLTRHKETWTVGNTIVVTHNLGTKDVLVVARDIDSGELVTLPTGWGNYDVGVAATSDNSITLTASVAPSGSGIAITVVQL